MRLFIGLIALSALVNAGVFVPAILQDVFTLKDLLLIGKPKIPQVILDTDHDWLTTNKKWLDRYPDVRTAICSIDSDLWTRPTASERALPRDLLAHINIDNNKYGVNRFGWKNAVDRLTELSNCPAALEAVKTLHIEIYVFSSKYDTWTESAMPPAKLPHLLADVLSRMPHLETLHWGISPTSTASFRTAFAEANVTLPSVRNLTAGGHSEWLVPRCPHLEKVSMGRREYFNDRDPSWTTGDDPKIDHGQSRLALIRAMEGLHLQSIHLVSSCWPGSTWMELLEALLVVQPDVPEIEMEGELFFGAEYLDEPERFEQHLRLLSRFENLTSLKLPSTWQLGIGVLDGRSVCGNAYMGPGGRARWRREERRSAAAIEQAGNTTLRMLPRLRQLMIGGYKGNITVGEEGQREVVWPWTGRLEECTYEEWPDVEYEFGDMEWCDGGVKLLI